MRSTHLSGAHRSFPVWMAFLACFALGTAVPAAAAHKARLSADLADHVRAGSPAIDVILHGTPQEMEALARRYNLRVRKLLRSGAVMRVTAGEAELEALQQDAAVDHLSAGHPLPFGSRASSHSRSAPIRHGRALACSKALLAGALAWRSSIPASIPGTGRWPAVSPPGWISPAATAWIASATVHVAATIAGAAGRLAETRDYSGIAPGARIINLRVLGDDGSGLASNVIEAIDWAIEHRKTYGIRVINLSLGAPVLQPYRDDPVCEAVERAVAAGIVVVAAAGNFGMTKEGKLAWGGITSPGNHPSAITVGAVDTHGTAKRSAHTVAPYSSRGPTRFDLVLKPDLVAPGSGVISAEAAASYLARTYPERHVAGAGADAYLQLSGTSMAAGVVSGAVALLLEHRRNLSPRETKAVLQLTSSHVSGEGLVASGAGAVNVLAAWRLIGLKQASNSTEIAGEKVWRSGLAFGEFDGKASHGAWLKPFLKDGTSAIVWNTDASDTIIWSTNDTIIGAPPTAQTQLFGAYRSNTTPSFGAQPQSTQLFPGMR